MINRFHPATQAAVDAGERDPEMLQFMAELETAIQDAKAGKFAAVHQPRSIKARERSKSAASAKPSSKEAIRISLDADVLAALRSTGHGWQTRINEMLRSSLLLAGKEPVQNLSACAESMELGANSGSLWHCKSSLDSKKR